MKVTTVLSLLEAKVAPLYHGTTADSAEKILATNNLTARAEIEPNALRYMRGARTGDKSVSFSRSISAARAFASGAPRRTGISGVVFVIDQALLSRDIGRRLNPYNDLTASSSTASRGAGSTEYEETVVGDVRNFNKYVSKIIVFVHPQYKDMLDPEMFPTLLNNPKTILTTNTTIKDLPNVYDRFASAKELEFQQQHDTAK
jgi:hypothetical protein